jgi:hypothetical protein
MIAAFFSADKARARDRLATSGLDQADAIVIELGREIFGARKVTSEMFTRALRQFGDRRYPALCLASEARQLPWPQSAGRQSGLSFAQYSRIGKVGRSHARAMLVETAWAARQGGRSRRRGRGGVRSA